MAERTSMPVAIVGPAGFAEKLTGALAQAKADVDPFASADIAAAEARLAESGGVLVLGPSVDEESVSASAQRLVEGGRIAVIAVLAEVTTDVMRRAMRAGVRDVLSASEQTWTEVAKAVVDAAEAVRRRGAGQAVAAGPAEKTRGRVVMVAGTKGGVGKTVLATNLAAAIAAKGTDTILVDLDLHTGDTGVMMQLEPRRTIRDAAIATDRLDEALLQGLLEKHVSGARVLLAPAAPDESGVITAARVVRILDLLSGMASVVILDTPAVWDEVTLAAADASDLILAMTTMDVPSVKNTGLMMARLRRLGRVNGNVKLVLNRADSKVLLEEKDVEKSLGTQLTGRIPSDRAVPRSVNKGVPIVMEAPRSGVAKAITQLSQAIIGGGK